MLACSLAAAQPATYLSVPGSGQAHFAYRVTLIPVSGEANGLSAKVRFDPSRPRAANGLVEVRLSSLKTGITLRDEHARDALGTDRFPTARFALQALEGISALPEGQTVSGTARGSFTLHGVARPLEAPVKLVRHGERIEVRAQFKVQPRDHGVNVRGADQTTTLDVSFVLLAQNE